MKTAQKGGVAAHGGATYIKAEIKGTLKKERTKRLGSKKVERAPTQKWAGDSQSQPPQTKKKEKKHPPGIIQFPIFQDSCLFGQDQKERTG